MSDAQKGIMVSVGLALFGIQGVEAKLKMLLSYAFPEHPDMTLKEMYDAHGKPSKETLGMLLKKLRERASVDDDFENLLTAFLQNRNRFVHGIMTERGFNPGDSEGIANLRKFIDEIECQCWHIGATLMGYLLIFAKIVGIHDEMVPQNSVYFTNLHKYFTSSLQPKDDETGKQDGQL